MHERTEDAPFVGALISAVDCNFNCKECFNQHLKNNETLYSTEQEIMNMVKSNIFNHGIILAGLEWSNQPEEALALIKCALRNNLDVILYTGMNIDEFKIKYPKLIVNGIYIKYGRFDLTQKTINHIEYGVTLASANQHIIKIEV